MAEMSYLNILKFTVGLYARKNHCFICLSIIISSGCSHVHHMERVSGKYWWILASPRERFTLFFSWGFDVLSPSYTTLGSNPCKYVDSYILADMIALWSDPHSFTLSFSILQNMSWVSLLRPQQHRLVLARTRTKTLHWVSKSWASWAAAIKEAI